jgi:hypothetical protein
MFNPKKIASKVEKASIQLIEKSPFNKNGSPIFKPGFVITEHSVNQCDQAVAHLNHSSIIEFYGDGKHKLKRGYTPDEVRWIRNERNMCRASFKYWATRYAYIIDWESNESKVKFNLAQEVILNTFSDMEAEELAILIQVLKARQAGVTTLSELIMLWLAMFRPMTNVLVASSRPDKSEEMVKKMDFCYRKQPYWLVPKIVTNNDTQIGFDDQNSFINIRHGAMLSGMGRGGTMTGFHLSEVTEYTNPDEAIDGALLRAVHDNPGLVGIFESTGAGRSGWYYDKWQFNKEYWPKRQSRLCPVFLPWYISTDIYPSPSWIKGHPIPADWEALDITKSHARRANDYVQSGENSIVTSIMGDGWVMPPEQMYFWEVTRQEYAASKKLNIFYQEMCADDKEAFQSQNSSVFSPDLLYELHENCPRPYGVYGLQAPTSEVPRVLQPDERDIDPNSPSINISCQWNSNQPKHGYKLVPLLHRGSAPFNPLGKIIMYEPPLPGESYALGTDCGLGIGQDRSVIQVLRKGSPKGPIEQVLEFASADINSFNLWPFNLAIGTLYSTRVGGQLRQAKQVIEDAAGGQNVYNELKKRGWREFHSRISYDKRRTIETPSNSQLWNTNNHTRPLLYDMLLDAINNGWLVINSPELIEELANLEIDMDKLRIAAAAGKKDDRVMGIAIPLFSLHALDTKYRDRWITRPTPNSPAERKYASYSEGSQGSAKLEEDTNTRDNYTYQVVKKTDPDAAHLAVGGPILWTPDPE